MDKDKIAEILGSNKVIEINVKPDGPLTYLHLIKEINARIAPKVGRPTDTKNTKYHNIPLTDNTWEKLKQKAKTFPGKKTLSASHLAAFLIEDGLKRLEKEMSEYNLEEINH